MTPSARDLLARFLLLFGALYAGFGVQSPYLPVLLHGRGLDAEALALVLAAATAVRLVAGPAAGRIADRLGAPRAVLAASALAAALLAPGYLAVSGLGRVLVVAALQAAALAPLAPLGDRLALAAALPRSRERPFRYGTVRGAGSAAFILGTLLSGRAVSGFGIGAMVWLNAALLVLAALAGAKAPLLAPAPAPSPLAGRRGLGAVLRLAMFRRLMLVAALILGSHALHDSFAVIRWGAVGIGPALAGVLWSEQVAAEVIVFLALGPPLLRRLGVARAAALAAGAGILRWLVMGATASLPAMMLIEPLHGLTFALLHLAAMQLLAEMIPAALAATALTVYGTLGLGLATALMTLASGPLYAHLGAHAFWVMAVICLAALPLALTLREPRLQNDAVVRRAR